MKRPHNRCRVNWRCNKRHSTGRKFQFECLESRALLTAHGADTLAISAIQPPVIAAQTLSVAEATSLDSVGVSSSNTVVGTIVGMVQASDPNVGGTLNFAILSGNGTGGGAFTVNATTGQLSVADPSQIDYETNPHFSLVVRVTNRGGLSASNVVTVNLLDRNDPPTITGALGGQPVNETAEILPFVGVTVTDADLPTQSMSATILLDDAAKGVFTTGSLSSTAPGAINWTLSAPGKYTATGTPRAVSAALRRLDFQPARHREPVGSTETTRFQITIVDGNLTRIDNTTSVASLAVNTAPTIAGVVSGQTVDDESTVSPFASTTIADPDVVARPVTGVDQGQLLRVIVSPSNAANGSFTLASLNQSGFVAGTGENGAPVGAYLFIGTSTSATEAIRKLAFQPTSNQVPPGATVTTTFTISADDDFVSPPVTNRQTSVIARSIGSPPVISGINTANQPVNDNGTLSPLTAVTISDPDLNSQLMVTIKLDKPANGTLSGTGITTVNGTPGAYRLSGSPAAVTTAIRGLVFRPTAHQVSPGASVATQLSIEAQDSGDPRLRTTAVGANLVVTSVNDAPTIAGSVAGQAVRDIETLRPFSKVTVADVDVGQTLTVTLTLDSPSKGQLSGGGIRPGSIPGTYTFSGAPAAVSTALRQVVFTPTAHRVAPGTTETTTIIVQVSDGLASVSDRTTTVVTTAVRSAPTVTGSTNRATDDRTALPIFNDWVITAPDAGATSGSRATLNVTITLEAASRGAFTTASFTAAAATGAIVFPNINQGIYTLTGTATQVQAAIRALVFAPTAGRIPVGTTESTQFDVSVDDGRGTAIARTLNLAVTPNNRAPTGLNFTVAIGLSFNDVTSTITATGKAETINRVRAFVIPAGTTLGTVRGVDPDLQDQFSYQLISGGQSTRFTIDATRGTLKIGSQPLARGSYTFQIAVSDRAGGTFVRSFVLTVV